ncbi:hypothetical protein NQ176_g10279 [Zarea fungicola]|uniref:Uncharacterized protein n=1 Tax=Zarea fungicola TaxID=93591 RepID=A0ACC1MH91_9HYPO|nr:hypothetical protein NQ176_g10279 [Lecanicillium fungicola]
MTGTNIDLNGDDMWDDSALVASWNEALDEYKKYHSIHAKGGSIKELQALSASKKTVKPEEDASSADDVAMEEGEASGQSTSQAPKQENATPEAANTVPAPAASPPEAVLGSVRDENLKKLLMSWYYAGYYTGLYEGQQQGQQEPPNQPQ